MSRCQRTWGMAWGEPDHQCALADGHDGDHVPGELERAAGGDKVREASMGDDTPWVEDGRGDLPKGHNLYCVACGETWKGTEAEAVQAELAQQAWEAEERRQVEATR